METVQNKALLETKTAIAWKETDGSDWKHRSKFKSWAENRIAKKMVYRKWKVQRAQLWKISLGGRPTGGWMAWKSNQSKFLTKTVFFPLWLLFVFFCPFRNKTFLFVKIDRWNFQHLFDLGFRETSENFSSFTIFPFFLLVVWISWNFVRFHEIQNQTDAENVSCPSWQTKKFYPKKNMSWAVGQDSFSNQQMAQFWNKIFWT